MITDVRNGSRLYTADICCTPLFGFNKIPFIRWLMMDRDDHMAACVGDDYGRLHIMYLWLVRHC